MIPRPLISVLVIVVVSAALIATRDVGYLSTKQHPPHVQAVDGHGTLSDYPDWIGALEDSRDAFYRENEEREQERLAAEEAIRVEAARRAANVPVARPGSSPTSCDGHIVPGYILQRESGCDYGAVNPTGCGGASCVGLYQFDLRHFTGGACSDLDWHSPADQDECARRLSNNGTNLQPWGG